MGSFFAFISRKSIFIFYIISMLCFCCLSVAFIYFRVNNCSIGSIGINGSTAFTPLLDETAQNYEKRCPFAGISVNSNKLPTGSFSGLAQVVSRTVDIGSSDVFATTSRDTDLEDHQIAVVIYALVVNNSVAVKNNSLTIDQIRGIYSGAITNWRGVGGNENLDIVRVSRPPTSGTRATFEKYVLGAVETISGPSSLINDTTDTVAKYVSTQVGAIGYVSLYYAKKYHLTVLAIDSTFPSVASVRSGSYQFWNIEHLYTKGPAQGLTKAFIAIMYSSWAEDIAVKDRFIPMSEITQPMLKRSSL